jgi:hypothetical protein
MSRQAEAATELDPQLEASEGVSLLCDRARLIRHDDNAVRVAVVADPKKLQQSDFQNVAASALLRFPFELLKGSPTCIPEGLDR